jgi:hypothetical protein
MASSDKKIAATKGSPKMQRLSLENQKLRNIIYEIARALHSVNYFV